MTLRARRWRHGFSGIACIVAHPALINVDEITKYLDDLLLWSESMPLMLTHPPSLALWRQRNQ